MVNLIKKRGFYCPKAAVNERTLFLFFSRPFAFASKQNAQVAAQCHNDDIRKAVVLQTLLPCCS